MKSKVLIVVTTIILIFISCTPVPAELPEDPTLIATTLPSASPTQTITPSPMPELDEEWIDYEIKYKLHLKDYSGWTKVWMPYPSEWDTQKNIALVDYSPETIQIHSDEEGNRIIFWNENISSEKVFYETFNISILKKKWNIDPNDVEVGEINDSDFEIYLASESRIQTNHPEIKQLSNEIVGDETNPYLKAELIYDYLTSNLLKGGDSNDALSTLRENNGQCGGVAFLYIALARAAGIPSRTVTGITNLREGVFNWQRNNFGTHVWVEFYLKDYGWIPTDLAHAMFSNKRMFAEFPGDYLIMSKGTDIDLEHGISAAPWFHMPYVNGTQEEFSDIYLIVQNISK